MLLSRRLNAEAIAEVFRSAKFDHADATAVAEHIVPSYWIRRQRAPLESLELGASRFGGSPDVPREFSWPKHNQRPLTFLAQIDLSKVEANHFPKHGWLLFFYEAVSTPCGAELEEAGCARVMYIDCPRELLTRSEHPDVHPDRGPFECCALEFDAMLDLPSPWNASMAARAAELRALNGSDTSTALTSEAVPALEGAADEAVFDWVHNYFAVEKELVRIDKDEVFAENISQYGGMHHLLGHPQQVQIGKDVRHAIPHAGEKTDWQLLLQLDSDVDGPGWMWCDAGRLLFWIRTTDLENHAFDKTWFTLDTSKPDV